MRARVDAATDVAMLGAWDEARNASALPILPHAQYRAALAADAEQGHLFLLQLGGDAGGPIDVFVDEDMPSALRKKLRRVAGSFLVSVPTGRLVVGGLEHYRPDDPKTCDSDVVALPAGDYELQCYFARDEEESGFVMPPAHEIEEAIGAEGTATRSFLCSPCSPPSSGGCSRSQQRS